MEFDKVEFEAVFKKALFDNSLPFEEKIRDFVRLAELLCKANEQMNLTAVKDSEGIAIKHFADSLKICSYIPCGAKMLDVGCGGGFPCLPVGIARKDLEIFALDSTEKKLTFVSAASKELSLNLKTLPGRAEDLSHNNKYREGFDFVCARAVAALPMLCELCLPFVKVGGVFAAMKTDTSELEESQNAIKTLGGKLEKIDSTPLYDMSRAIIIIRKEKHTPIDYPRAFPKIKNKHL